MPKYFYCHLESELIFLSAEKEGLLILGEFSALIFVCLGR